MSHDMDYRGSCSRQVSLLKVGSPVAEQEDTWRIRTPSNRKFEQQEVTIPPSDNTASARVSVLYFAHPFAVRAPLSKSCTVAL